MRSPPAKPDADAGKRISRGTPIANSDWGCCEHDRRGNPGPPKVLALEAPPPVLNAGATRASALPRSLMTSTCYERRAALAITQFPRRQRHRGPVRLALTSPRLRDSFHTVSDLTPFSTPRQEQAPEHPCQRLLEKGEAVRVPPVTQGMRTARPAIWPAAIRANTSLMSPSGRCSMVEVSRPERANARTSSSSLRVPHLLLVMVVSVGRLK